MPEQTQAVVKKIQGVYLPATNTEESAKWQRKLCGSWRLGTMYSNDGSLKFRRIT